MIALNDNRATWKIIVGAESGNDLPEKSFICDDHFVMLLVHGFQPFPLFASWLALTTASVRGLPLGEFPTG